MNTRTNAINLLKQIDYDFHGFTMDGFVEWIQKTRGIEISFVPHPMADGNFGLSLFLKNEPKVIILYRSNMTRLQQVHTQLHELAHILFNHAGTAVEDSKVVSILTDILGPDNTGSYTNLCRSRAIAIEEQEAEHLVHLIQEKVIAYSRLDELNRIASSLDDVDGIVKDWGII